MWGILTEPLKGTLSDSENIIMNNYTEYIPASFVSFIEQTGARVIPVSYKLTRDSFYNLLGQLNGLALFGDSGSNLEDPEFQATFSFLVTYMFDNA